MLHRIASLRIFREPVVRLTGFLHVLACLLLLGAASQLQAQVTTAQPVVNFGSVAVGASTGNTQTLSFTGGVGHHAG